MKGKIGGLLVNAFTEKLKNKIFPNFIAQRISFSIQVTKFFFILLYFRRNRNRPMKGKRRFVNKRAQMLNNIKKGIQNRMGAVEGDSNAGGSDYSQDYQVENSSFSSLNAWQSPPQWSAVNN